MNVISLSVDHKQPFFLWDDFFYFFIHGGSRKQEEISFGSATHL